MIKRIGYILTSLILIISLISGCSKKSVIQTDKENVNAIPTLQTSVPTSTPEEQISEEPKTNENIQSTPNAAYSFVGKCPETVNAGKPFELNFSITNNRDITVIAATLQFQDLNMAQEINPDEGWQYKKGGLLTNPSISTSNIFIKKGETLTSTFSLLVMEPGTYQFKINPQVKAGDWHNVGTYVASFQVLDTQKAKATRETEATLSANKEKIKDLNNQIEKLKNDIEYEKNNISYEKDNITYANENIKNSEDMKKDAPDNADVYNEQIKMYREQISESNVRIAEIQGKINSSIKQVQDLTAQRDSLIKQNEKLKN